MRNTAFAVATSNWRSRITLILSNVPAAGSEGQQRHPPPDVAGGRYLYDHRVKLIISAAAPLVEIAAVDDDVKTAIRAGCSVVCAVHRVAPDRIPECGVHERAASAVADQVTACCLRPLLRGWAGAVLI